MDASAIKDLRRQALCGLVQFTVLMMALIFLPAWSLDYWQAWLFLGVFVACLALCNEFFLRRDPELVRRRLRVGPAAEREPAQKRIQALASLMLVALFVVSALDHRFGWSHLPGRAAILGDLGVVAGLLLISRVFIENSFAAATVQVDAGQHVVDTGPYGMVRHPMYTAAIVMLAGIPPALDSAWGLLIIPLAVGILALRLHAEERFLEHHLAGYEEYRRRVRWHLVPGVW